MKMNFLHLRLIVIRSLYFEFYQIKVEKKQELSLN